MARSRSRSPGDRRRRSRSRERRHRRDRSRSRERRRRGGAEDRDADRNPPGAPAAERRSRSRSRSRERKWDKEREKRKREKESTSSVAMPGRSSVVEGQALTDKDFAGKSDEEIQMMKVMGFGGFETTKGKKVKGNDVGEVHHVVKRKYRQYMNRKGGFNRPLDFVH